VIDADVLERVLGAALGAGGEWAEVFAEDRVLTSVHLDDRRIDDLSTGRERGAGIRVVRGGTTGYAHTTDLSEPGLRTAAVAAAGAASDGGGGTRSVALDRTTSGPTRLAVEARAVDRAGRADALRLADEAARAESDAISQVSATWADSRRHILVANSDGLLVEDDQIRTRFIVQCVAVGDTGLQTAHEGPGNVVGAELLDRFPADDVARRAARRAVTMLAARPAPSGRLPVVLRQGAGGVLFHEACGHGLEADLVARDASVFAGRVGEAVASPLVTLVDDATYGLEWGTYAIDDEGQPGQRTTLIDGGVLTDYIWDVTRARRAGRSSTGNGRRQSYRHVPMARMTNTYVLAGADDPDDIVRDTERGIYCAQLGGGQVNTATGDFVFGMTEAYLIEGGEITHPIRAANLIGNGPEVLLDIDAVGNDFDTWAGTCGKDGQGVPVSAGQPTLRVKALTIGGTAA
jgi:TldD protein